MSDEHYPDVPGSVRESRTSGQAADAALEFAHTMADRCERWFKSHTIQGQLMTCEECEIAAQEAGALGRHQTISARIRTDLYLKRQCLWKVGTHQVTGQSIRVWYTTDTSELIADDKGRIIYDTKRNTSGRSAWVYGWGYENK